MAAQADAEMEEYNSASDEDFNPAAGTHASDVSSSEDEDGIPTVTKAPRKKRKTRSATPDLVLDSGDEATIQERRGKKRRAGSVKGDTLPSSEDEGGEGGLIKTRAQRRLEEKERRPLAGTDGATVDIESIWATMTSAPTRRVPDDQCVSSAQTTRPPEDGLQISNGAKDAPAPHRAGSTATHTTVAANADEEYITIKRTYTFAGEDHHEERRVLKSSAEARLHLASQQARGCSDPGSSSTREPALAAGPRALRTRRPLKRPSRFEPNPSGEVRGLSAELQLTWPRKDAQGGAAPRADGRAQGAMRRPPPRPPQPAKLNTVEKSRYDWAGYVDKEGIAEELDEHGRSKQSYAGRMDFLNRMEVRLEGERREARAKQG